MAGAAGNSYVKDYESSNDAEEGFPVSKKNDKLDSEMQELKKMYLDQYNERKRLYNEVIELKGNIRVFCRYRPLTIDEVSNGSETVVLYSSSQEVEISSSPKKFFQFDHVFKPEDNQEDVFVKTVPIVTSVLDGFNVCIFAYGQTGTGKTFTMEGTPECRGVNYRTLEELLRVSNERGTFMKYELLVSMLEVYNEKIRDLLIENCNQPAKKLDIKQSAEGNQEVPGLVEARVYDKNEVWELLESGSRARSVGSTCLVRVTVLGENHINGQRTRSHLWLVDLEGSERRNKSLSALGNVLSALASKTTHIRYRSSTLTHLLQSSLGGDCKLFMFVHISPKATDVGETLLSLDFGSKVGGPKELFKYKQLLHQAENAEKEKKLLEVKCSLFEDKVKYLKKQLEEASPQCRTDVMESSMYRPGSIFMPSPQSQASASASKPKSSLLPASKPKSSLLKAKSSVLNILKSSK